MVDHDTVFCGAKSPRFCVVNFRNSRLHVRFVLRCGQYSPQSARARIDQGVHNKKYNQPGAFCMLFNFNTTRETSIGKRLNFSCML